MPEKLERLKNELFRKPENHTQRIHVETTQPDFKMHLKSLYLNRPLTSNLKLIFNKVIVKCCALKMVLIFSFVCLSGWAITIHTAMLYFSFGCKTKIICVINILGTYFIYISAKPFSLCLKKHISPILSFFLYLEFVLTTAKISQS